MTRTISLAVALGVLSAPGAFAAGPFGAIHVGNWNGGAYTDDKTGVFSHCAAATTYLSGTTVSIGQNSGGAWLLAILHPAWQLSTGETIPFDVTFDGQSQYHLFGNAATNVLAVAVLPNNAAVEQLRKHI
jgi:hypothetical protein